MPTHEKKLFSFTDKDDLLKLREQYNSDIHYHGQALIEVQKYFTILLSALLTVEVTLFTATFSAFSTFFLENRLAFLLYFPIPVIIWFLSSIASVNNKREYRNGMEYMGVRMKIDELLGTYDENYYCELKRNRLLQVFQGDTVFGNPRWRESRDTQWKSISSKDFVEKMINEKKGAYWHLVRVYNIFRVISIGIIIILIILIMAPLITI